MPKALPQLELMRSETFPFAQRFAVGASPLGSLAYFDSGDPSDRDLPAKSSPPILLLHALGTNYTAWEYVAPALAAHTRTIGFDMPGCGHSVRPSRPYRLADIRDAAWGLLDQLGVDRPLLCGHSFGGRVAIEMALSQPGRAAGLCLVNSAGLIRYPAYYGSVGARLLQPKLVGSLVVALAPLLVGRIFAQPSPRSQRFLDQVLGRVELGVAYDFANHACPLLPDLVSDVLDRLAELKLPMHVLWGDRDALLPLSQVAPALAQLGPHTAVSLLNCGHMPNIEQPEQVARTILALLESLRRDAGS
jgi:pimeloyl-ACP methyl ester carboxylesterase